MAQAAPFVGPTGRARTCLVVDDSRVVRKVARRILEGWGFSVREAADGSEAPSSQAGEPHFGGD